MMKFACAALVACALASVGPLTAYAQADAQAQAPDGADDFDWEIGAWDTHVRVRAPLSTEDRWSEYRAASIVHGFAERRANLVDLAVSGPAGRIEGVSLRLYNPQTRQWSLHFASMRDGVLTPPVYGGFVGGRGVFYGQDSVDGRAVLVRFIISDVTANAARFEQAFSADGGQTWIVNWIATDTRRR